MRSCSPRAGRTRSCTGRSSRSGRSLRVVGFGVMAAGRLLASPNGGLWQKSACHNPRSRNASGRTSCWRPTEIATIPKTPTPGWRRLLLILHLQRDVRSRRSLGGRRMPEAERPTNDERDRRDGRARHFYALSDEASRRPRSSRTSRSWERRPCCAGRCCRSPSP